MEPKEDGESSFMIKILTVCLGNICRSPAAEAVFKMKLHKAGISAYVDSAGTSGHHNGEMSDKRMRIEAQKRDIEITSFSRQINSADIKEFDYIIVMDESNYENVLKLVSDPNDQAKIYKMIDFTSEKYGTYDEIPDPYWSGQEGFALVLDMLDDASENFIQRILV
jgi:protein-tyrosine phosphatase